MSQSRVRPLLGLIAAFTVALLVTLALGVLAYRTTQDQQHRLDRQQQLLDHYEIRVCERTNTIRASDNASHQSDYRVYTQVALLFAHDHAAGSRRLASSIAADAKAKTWTPLTDCAEVSGGKRTSRVVLSLPTYRFSQQPPPASQLSITNAQQPSPVGSVR